MSFWPFPSSRMPLYILYSSQSCPCTLDLYVFDLAYTLLCRLLPALFDTPRFWACHQAYPTSPCTICHMNSTFSFHPPALLAMVLLSFDVLLARSTSFRSEFVMLSGILHWSKSEDCKTTSTQFREGFSLVTIVQTISSHAAVYRSARGGIRNLVRGDAWGMNQCRKQRTDSMMT